MTSKTGSRSSGCDIGKCKQQKTSPSQQCGTKQRKQNDAADEPTGDVFVCDIFEDPSHHQGAWYRREDEPDRSPHLFMDLRDPTERVRSYCVSLRASFFALVTSRRSPRSRALEGRFETSSPHRRRPQFTPVFPSVRRQVYHLEASESSATGRCEISCCIAQTKRDKSPPLRRLYVNLQPRVHRTKKQSGRGKEHPR